MNSIAQNENSFQLSFGLQWNLPERYFNNNLSKFNGQNSGIGVHLYPKWHYNENLTFGVNLEYASVQEEATTNSIGTFDIFSLSPTVNYYLTKTKVRPYLGFGVGLYTVSRADKTLSVGVRPLIGVSVNNRFDLSFEYSRILGDLNIDPNVSQGFGNYYLSLKGSYSIPILERKKNKS